MIRTIITPDSPIISLKIPPRYIGKQIEIIAFAKDEGINGEQFAVKKASFEALSLDTKSYKFNRGEANER